MAVVEYAVEAPVEVLTEEERRARTLEGAALALEVYGWCRGKAKNDHGEMCAVGALKATLGFDPMEPMDVPMVDGVTRVWGSDNWSDWINGLPSFNDAASSAEEVTFLLRWRAEEIRDGWDA